jgi:serine/threonine protein kinase
LPGSRDAVSKLSPALSLARCLPLFFARIKAALASSSMRACCGFSMRTWKPLGRCFQIGQSESGGVNERFIRCSLCGYPHAASEEFCPITRRPIRKSHLHQPALNPAPVQSQAPPEARSPPRGSNPRPLPPRPAPAIPSADIHVPVISPTPTPSALPHQALIGMVIGGKYEIRSLLGSGGMGSVFEAVHVGIRRHCAIKILNANQLQKKDAVKRFHHEARAAARIGHPNICEVYDLGTLDDGRPYLVMEKLVGETWADCIAREGGLPFADIIDVMRQVLSGLYAAHENGIIHRDIKPENVFLSKRVGCPPVAKILDFGVSKMISRHPQSKDDGDLEMTRTGIVLGTPYYLAPEQARGDRNLDARVDLYACGVMLYEAIVGRRPFVAANYNALLIQILTGAPRPIREYRKDIPEDLVLIVDKAMGRERHQRYQSAVDFQTDLQQVELPPTPSRVPPRPAPPSRPPPPAPPAPAAFNAPRPPVYASMSSTREGNTPTTSRPSSHRQGAAPLPSPGVRDIVIPPQVATTPRDVGAVRDQVIGRGRDQLLRALPIAGAEDTAPHRPTSSAEIDALIGMDVPGERELTQKTPSRGSRARSKGGQGFDDQPTEVQLPHLGFFDDESTARGLGEEVARIRARSQEHARLEEAARQKSAPPQAVPRPGPAGTRQKTLLEKKHPDFADDSKTDVMSPDLSSRIRESHAASAKQRPNPSGHGRGRRG